MHNFYLFEAAQVDDATKMIAAFGEAAAFEAGILAGRGAIIGNHLTYCRWRQIERLIILLMHDAPSGTIH
jgi:hypothetical protein